MTTTTATRIIVVSRPRASTVSAACLAKVRSSFSFR